jgi:hypothetical protein
MNICLCILASMCTVWVSTAPDHHAMTEAVSHQPVSAEACVQSQASLCGIGGGQGDSGMDFSLSTLVFLC